MKNWNYGLAIAVLVGVAACSDTAEEPAEFETQVAAQVSFADGGIDGGVVGTANGPGDAAVSTADGGAACASLSYASVGKPFMQKYCAACHQGASGIGGVDVSTLEGIRKSAVRIDARAVKTPASMPPTGMPQPTADERQKLGDWLNRCGAN